MKQRWMLLALVAFLISWQSVVPTSVQERVLMTYDTNDQQLDTSAQDRVTIWNDAMNLFQQNPVIGIGFDTYEWLHRVTIYTDTHNYFLKVMVETGVIGLMFFLFLLMKMSRMGYRLFRTAEDPFLKSLGLACVPGHGLRVRGEFLWRSMALFAGKWIFMGDHGVRGASAGHCGRRRCC